MGEHSKSSYAPSSLGDEEGDMQMHLLRKKHCPGLCIFRGRRNLSKSHHIGNRTETHTLSQTCIDQPYTRGTDTLKLLLFFFFGFDKTKILQILLDKILSLLLNQGKHNEDIAKVKLVKYRFLFLMWLMLLMSLFMLTFASRYALWIVTFVCFFVFCFIFVTN